MVDKTLDSRRKRYPSIRGVQPGIRYECIFPGCKRIYGTTDAVRKHCRKKHPKWWLINRQTPKDWDSEDDEPSGLILKEPKRGRYCRKILAPPSPPPSPPPPPDDYENAFKKWWKDSTDHGEWQLGAPPSEELAWLGNNALKMDPFADMLNLKDN